MGRRYTCSGCGIESDYKPSNERSCNHCGYPLDIAELLEFLRSNQGRILKVERTELSDSMETSKLLKEQEDFLSPERFINNEIVISIVNTKFHFTVK